MKAIAHLVRVYLLRKAQNITHSTMCGCGFSCDVSKRSHRAEVCLYEIYILPALRQRFVFVCFVRINHVEDTTDGEPLVTLHVFTYICFILFLLVSFPHSNVHQDRLNGPPAGADREFACCGSLCPSGCTEYKVLYFYASPCSG